MTKHAVITGGGRGIGAAIAKALSGPDKNLTLMGRTAATLRETASALPNAQAVVCDVENETSVRQAFEQAVARFGPVTVLINNAGIAASSPLARTSLDEFQRVININLTGTFLCTREVLPAMQEAKVGRIVNVASTAGLGGNPYISAYSASKHGVIGLTRCLALEVAGVGITVNAVCPGYTDTDMAQQAIDTVKAKTGRDDATARAAIVADNPQGRMIAPQEVADTVAWLCSEQATGVTGQAIMIA